MKKSELISEIAKRVDCPKTEVKKVLDSFLAVTTETLKNNDRVILLGFGTFSVTERGPRKGRNPYTKTTINIPAKKVVKFKAEADLNLNA